MRFSKAIIRSDSLKVMAKFGFGCRFYDLKYLKLEVFHFP